MGWGERKESDRGYCGESEKARVWSVGDEEGGWRGVDAVKGGVKRTKPRGGGNRGGARGSSDTWRGELFGSYKAVKVRYIRSMIQPEPEGSTQELSSRESRSPRRSGKRTLVQSAETCQGDSFVLHESGSFPDGSRLLIVAQRVASAIETIAIYESKTSVPRNSRNQVKRQEDKVEENASNIGHGKVTMVEVLASNKTKDIK
ncbi:hypothetical protein Tco_1335834 [Tanacetum coccineum]